MLDCTCNDEITWFTCPLHGISRGVNYVPMLNSDGISQIDFREIDLNFEIPVAIKTEEEKEFEKCKDFSYWFKNYFLPLKKSEFCFDCEDTF